jgi:hypothetical protein
MLSAPAAIPAMIEVSFPAGLTPADLTAVERSTTFSPISSESPACSARPITGASPAHDTRRSSSNTGVARDHASGSFTSSAFSARTNQELDTPDSPDREGTLTIRPAETRPRPPSRSTDRG